MNMIPQPTLNGGLLFSCGSRPAAAACLVPCLRPGVVSLCQSLHPSAPLSPVTYSIVPPAVPLRSILPLRRAAGAAPRTFVQNKSRRVPTSALL